MKPIPAEVQKEIVSYYLSDSKIHCVQTAKKFNISPSGVHLILKRHGVKIRPRATACRKYSCDETFFEKIDTEERAYILGLLFADGCVMDDSSIRLGLQSRDRDILIKINTLLKNSRPISVTKLSDKHPNWQDHHRIVFQSKKMKDDLVSLGCTPRKTFSLKFPINHIPERLLHHFIRGYFDGDGCFYAGKLKSGSRKGDIKYSVGMVSTKSFCKTVEQLIKKYTDVNVYTDARFPERNNSTRQIKISGRIGSYKFLGWIYKDATIYLQRKYDKYIEHINDGPKYAM